MIDEKQIKEEELDNVNGGINGTCGVQVNTYSP